MSAAPFNFVPLPAARSKQKPRRSGLTMIVDDGLPLAWARDIVALAGNYIDLAKIKTGTARLYPREQLVAKLRLYRRNRIQPFLGGQFHEYIYATQGAAALPRYYAEALELGFKAIEISDNVVPLTDDQRRAQIRAAARAGLIVYGEVGSKELRSDPRTLVRQAEACFEAGAALVLIEAAELAERGRLRRSAIECLTRSLDMSRVMIELPGPWIRDVRSCDVEELKRALVREFGPDVNLANVTPASVIDTEATRTGLGTAGPPRSARRRGAQARVE